MEVWYMYRLGIISGHGMVRLMVVGLATAQL